MNKKGTAQKPLVIAGVRIEPDGSYDLHLEYSESYTGVSVSIPIKVIRAPKDGPCVFLTGLVHGDELNGLGIIQEVLFERTLQLSRGTLIAIPVVNIYGLEMHSRYLPDRRDLNRSFPGTAKGSLTSRLAQLIYKSIICHCDYGIDFHTAAVRRTNYPNIRADLHSPKVLELAKAFGCELIVHSSGYPGSLRRVAVRRGIPTIVLEAGEVWKIEPGIVEMGVRGTLNVLKYLRMVPGRRSTPVYQTLIHKSRWIRAERGGVLRFHVQAGDLVRAGQTLATNIGILGQKFNRIESPSDGVILGMTTMPAVKPGDPIFHLAIPEESLGLIQKRINRRKKGALHSRIHEELATNVLVSTPRRKTRR